jgi:hypothetical protein
MGRSLRSANRNTHIRIVAVALVAAIGLVIVSMYARITGPGTVIADVKTDRPLVKAGQRATYTESAISNVR